MSNRTIIELYDDNALMVADILGISFEELGQLLLVCRIKNIKYIDQGGIKKGDHGYRIDISNGFPRERKETDSDPNQTMLPIPER